MKTVLAKGAAGLIGASGLGVSGYYGIQYLNKETKIKKVNISNRLEEEKYTLLNSNSQNFSTILQNYKTATQSKTDYKFGDFAGDKVGKSEAKDILLEHCKSALENEDINSTDYEKAKRWCVDPVTVSELLGKRGINGLNTNASPHADDEKWKVKIKGYRSSSVLRIDGLSFSSSGETDPTPTEITQIKTQCRTIKDKKNHEDKFEETLKAFEKWCSQQ